MRKLFRQEAIDAQREKLLGEVSLARPVPLWVFTLLALAAAAALIAFALWGEYTRRERVDGYLALTAGSARILAPETGQISELLVKEGDEVAELAPIARLSLERGTTSGAVSSELVQRELSQRINNLEAEKLGARRLAEQQVDQLRRRIADLTNETIQIDSEIKLQATRVASARQEFQRTQELVAQKFTSEAALTDKRNDVLDQETKLAALRRTRLTLERELGTARAELPTIETKTLDADRGARAPAKRAQAEPGAGGCQARERDPRADRRHRDQHRSRARRVDRRERPARHGAAQGQRPAGSIARADPRDRVRASRQ